MNYRRLLNFGEKEPVTHLRHYGYQRKARVKRPFSVKRPMQLAASKNPNSFDHKGGVHEFLFANGRAAAFVKVILCKN